MKNKTIITRISAFLCVMICVLGIVAQPLTVSASINYKYHLPLGLCSMYKYYSLAEWHEGELILFLSDELLEHSGYKHGGPHVYTTYTSTDGRTWTHHQSFDTSAGGWISTNTGHWKLLFDNVSTAELYNLGYLRDLSFTSQLLTGGYLYKFDFGNKTSSGYEINPDECVIRIWGKLTYYDTTTKLKAYEADTSVVVGDYGFSDDFSIKVGLQQIWDAVASVTEPLDMATVTQMGYVRSDQIYLQLYNTRTNAYGGYTLFVDTGRQVGPADTVTTITPEGDIDPDGYVGQAPNGNQIIGGGSGSNTGGSNGGGITIGGITIPSIDLSGFSTFSDALNDVSASLGSVSNAFASVFGFLPPWCLSLFGLSVGAMILVALVKFIRG